MDAITVGGENPAVNIMRKVIERKQQWRESLETYETQVYSRFTMTGESNEIIMVNESAATAYWDQGQGMREVVKGSKATSIPFMDEGDDMTAPAALTVANLYDDNLNIAGHDLIGVTHPNALSSYKYTLEGVRVRDGLAVYDIAVEPNNRLISGFIGRVSILDSVYAMVDAELTPGKSFLFPPPIRNYEITFRQQFSSFGGEYWMPVDFQSRAEMEVGFQGLLTFAPFVLDHVARFTDYQVNVSLPSDLFDSIASFQVDSTALEEGEIFTEPGLAVPLTSEEQEAYDNEEIEDDFAEAFKPRGALGRLVGRRMEELREDDGREPGNGERGNNAGTGRSSALVRRVTPSIRYNTVEGFHFGLRRPVSLGEHFYLTGGAGINSAQKGKDLWPWFVSAGYASSGTGVRPFIEGRYENQISPRYGEYDFVASMTNFTAIILGKHDYFDYYGRQGFSVSGGLRFPSPNLGIGVSYLNEDHRTVFQGTSYDFLGEPPFAENRPIVEGNMQSLTANLRIGNPQRSSGITGNRLIELSAEFSLPGSDYDFQRFWGKASWRQVTFSKRRFLPAYLQVRVEAGYGSDMLPLQRAFIIPSRIAFTTFPGQLRGILTRPFEGDRAVALMWEHNFRTIPFEILGLRGLAKSGISLIVFGGHGKTWLSDTVLPLDSPPRKGTDGAYHELGFSIAGILGWLRVDFAKPLDDGVPTIGASFYLPF